MRWVSVLLLLLIVTVFTALSSRSRLTADQPPVTYEHAPAVVGTESALYVGPYQASEHGMVTMPLDARWNVYCDYLGQNRETEVTTVEDCVLLVLVDSEASHWPVVSKMDLQAARELRDRLSFIINLKVTAQALEEVH